MLIDNEDNKEYRESDLDFRDYYSELISILE